MTTMNICMSNFRPLTMKMTFIVILFFCVVCTFIYVGYRDEQLLQDLNSDTDLRLFITTTNNNTSALIKVTNQNIYILSAIIPTDLPYLNHPAVVVNIFGVSDDRLYCCIVDEKQRLHKSLSSKLRQFHHQTFLSIDVLSEYFFPAPFPARQLICPLVSPAYGATHISLSSGKCSTRSNKYKPIVHVRTQMGGLAICAKVAYGDSLQASRLVEWMEIQKLMGVDKVVIFTLDISSDVRKVFDHYVKEGFLTTVPYELAGNIKRGFSAQNRSLPQFLHDEQLAIFDCRERLSGYSHVAGIDLDEIIIPRSARTLKELLQVTLARQYRDAGAYYFHQQFHITDWGPSNPENALTITRYLQTDPPRWLNWKYVYLPSRTEYARTHTAFVTHPYKTYIIPPEVAVIHHFRVCPEPWKDCHTRPRIVDNSTLLYEKQLYPIVKNVLMELNKRR